MENKSTSNRKFIHFTDTVTEKNLINFRKKLRKKLKWESQNWKLNKKIQNWSKTSIKYAFWHLYSVCFFSVSEDEIAFLLLLWIPFVVQKTFTKHFYDPFLFTFIYIYILQNVSLLFSFLVFLAQVFPFVRILVQCIKLLFCMLLVSINKQLNKIINCKWGRIVLIFNCTTSVQALNGSFTQFICSLLLLTSYKENLELNY